MGAIDDARQAGFSEDEIGTWANGQRDDWRAAGFSDQEIDQHLTGQKNPRQIPPGLLGRFREAVSEGVAAGFGEKPLGLTPEDQKKLGTAAKLPLFFGANLEELSTGVETAFRSVNAGLMGLGAGVGQAAGEVTGANEAETARARRDWANMVSIAALLSGAHMPMRRPGVGPADEVVGHLPKAQDFTDATKIVTSIGETEISMKGGVPPEVRQKIVDLYESHGIHPAEVAADAQADIGVAAQLRRGEMPERYAPKVEEPAPEPPPRNPEASRPPTEEPTPPVKPGEEYRALSEDGIPADHYRAAEVGGEPPREPPRGPPSGGDAPPGPPPGGLGAPPEQPARAPYFTYDDRPGWRKAFTSMIDGYKKTFQPELVSDRALTADPLFARYKSMQAQGHDAAIARAEEMHQHWRTVPEPARLEYMDRFERQRWAEMPEEQRPLAERHKTMLSEAYQMEREFGSKAAYVQDYFPHIWQDPEQARNFVNARIAQLGPKWFQKERTFNFIQEGIEAGLRLKSTNPEDLVTQRLMASADMVERMRLLGDLKEMNLATEAAGAEARLVREGWTPINAPNREQWLIGPDIQPLWKNAVEAKGFWSNEGAAGSAFRGWMAFKNVWVPLKLALSLFHPLHVLHINYAEGFARAWGQLTTGDAAGALKSAAEGLYGPLQAMAPKTLGHPGKLAREAWLLKESERTPAQKAMVDLMNDGGFVPQLSEQLRINAQRAFEDARDNANWFKMIPQGMRRAIEVAQAPIFQEWIPNLKTAAYLQDAQALLSRQPELLTDATQRRVALRTASKSVDNRFGEMFYGGLFWNRYLKDAGIGSFLSLGWNLGFAREFGGALLQPEARLIRRLARGETETEATIAAAQNKLSFVVAYTGSAMMINGMMTYLIGGQSPEGLDWFLPRIGGTNPDGSPRRVTNMFYTREVPMAKKHIEEAGVAGGLRDMLWNKLMFQPIKEMLENRTYYGADIWDENGPAYRQAQQAVTHIFKEQLAPMSITGANRALKTGGHWWEAGMAMMGFGPAPAYAEKSATQNHITHMFQRYVAPFSRPADMGEKSKTRGDIRTELLLAKQRGDSDGVQAAAQKWFKEGGSRQGLSNMMLGIGTDVSMFRALPEPAQQAIMEQATAAERARYQPWMKSNISGKVADLMVDAQKARGQGNEAAAGELETKIQTMIEGGIRDGHITNSAAFRRAVSQHLIARHAPDLSAIMTLPKKMRGQFVQPTP